LENVQFILKVGRICCEPERLENHSSKNIPGKYSILGFNNKAISISFTLFKKYCEIFLPNYEICVGNSVILASVYF
jgi:hypothetical protein